jgi:hypothetical protein
MLCTKLGASILGTPRIDRARIGDDDDDDDAEDDVGFDDDGGCGCKNAVSVGDAEDAVDFTGVSATVTATLDGVAINADAAADAVVVVVDGVGDVAAMIAVFVGVDRFSFKGVIGTADSADVVMLVIPRVAAW